MKRLLAYSSIENIGIMFTGLGLAIVFAGVGMRPLAALTLIAVMYHALNHAVMKSLLFLGTGAVLHATGERNLGRLGGLIHRMPWVAWLTLIGALAIAGLPPLNGFVSEWLLLQSFLLAYQGAARLHQHAAAPGRRAACTRGRPRGLCHGQILRGDLPRSAAGAHPATGPRCGIRRALRARLARARAACCWDSFQPPSFRCFSVVTQQLGLGELPLGNAPWWLLLPHSRTTVLLRTAGVLCRDFAGRSHWPLSMCGIFYHQRVRRSGRLGLRIRTASPAACRTPRKDSVSRSAIYSNPSSSSYANCRARSMQHPRIAWKLAIASGSLCMSPLGPLVRRVADKVAWLQQGRIATYLLYSFVTLVVLAGAHAMNPFDWAVQVMGICLGARGGTRVSRLGESVPRLAAEPSLHRAFCSRTAVSGSYSTRMR